MISPYGGDTNPPNVRVGEYARGVWTTQIKEYYEVHLKTRGFFSQACGVSQFGLGEFRPHR